MSKKRKKKNNHQIIMHENYLSKEQIVDMQAEAYYRALKRIEMEKLKADEQKSEKKKYKWYENVLLVLNVCFWPWKISKRFSINNQIHEDLLVMAVSGMFHFIGGVAWLFGGFAIIYSVRQFIFNRVVSDIINYVMIEFVLLLLGGTFILAGRTFAKETDSNKIYAYSASVIALVSCIISIIALLVM